MLNPPEVPPPDPPANPRFQKPTFYSKLLLAIAALMVLWVFFSRWWQNRAIESRTREAAAEKQREQDRATLEQMGGQELAIHVDGTQASLAGYTLTTADARGNTKSQSVTVQVR